MEFISTIIDFFLHLDRYLGGIIQQYGVWTYLILFVIIFSETGLVVAPFLPGDSLLFAAGALAATGAMDPVFLFIILSIAAITGNTVNYWVGYYIGPGILKKKKIKFIKQEYLEKTHKFYEKYGGVTLVIARFIPIIRTFAPFVAGLGSMNQWRFHLFNITAGVAWVGLFVFGGYFFGNLPVVKNNFSIVIIAIILISVLPGIIGYFRTRSKKGSAPKSNN